MGLSKFTFVDPFESRCNGSADLSLALAMMMKIGLGAHFNYSNYFFTNFGGIWLKTDCHAKTVV